MLCDHGVHDSQHKHISGPHETALWSNKRACEVLLSVLFGQIMQLPTPQNPNYRVIQARGEPERPGCEAAKARMVI